jgi:hypothetical protein
MNRIRLKRRLTAALTAAACLGAATGSSAQHRAAPAAAANHDGVYAVEIFTRQGFCDKV